jgi:hypothetical protein
VVNDELTPWKAAQYVGVSPITLQAWVSTHAAPELRELRVVPDFQLEPTQSIQPMSNHGTLMQNERAHEHRSASSVVLEMKNGSRLILEGNYAERVLAHALSEVARNA